MWRLLLVVVVVACGRGPASTTPDAGDERYVPGEPIVLSGAGNDEDPAVLAASDGSVYVAWYSEAAGNDIVIRRTVDGVTWSPPVHVSTDSASNDFGPTLAEDAAGTIHAAWFRWRGTMPPGRIVYNHSRDGVSWDRGTEVDVTAGMAADDWVPSLTADDGRLVVAFARNTCPPPATCYAVVASSSTDGATWSVPATIAAGGGEQHHLPTLAVAGAELVVAWDPYAASASAPWADATTQAHVATAHSSDGATWSAASLVTPARDAAVTLFPDLYADHDGMLHVAYVDASADGQRVVELPLGGASTSHVLPIGGYSPRIVAVPRARTYLAAWVGGTGNEHDIYVRVFEDDP